MICFCCLLLETCIWCVRELNRVISFCFIHCVGGTRLLHLSFACVDVQLSSRINHLQSKMKLLSRSRNVGSVVLSYANQCFLFHQEKCVASQFINCMGFFHFNSTVKMIHEENDSLYNYVKHQVIVNEIILSCINYLSDLYC